MIIKKNKENFNHTWKAFIIVAFIMLLAIDIYQARSTEIMLYGHEAPIEIYDYIDQFGFKGVDVEVCYNCTYKIADYISYQTTTKENAPAYYDIKNDKIIIRPDMLQSSPIEHSWHEYGHHVWYTKLSKEQKQNYTNIYNEATEFVTTYAIEGGVKEDFAESFAYYMIGKKDQLSLERTNYFVKLRNQEVI